MAMVNLKGTGSGIILELDSKASFETLIPEVEKKFRDSKSFLGRASMGMIIKGRVLYDREENEILKAISENCNVNITCVLREDPETDRIFASYIRQPEPQVQAPEEPEEPEDSDDLEEKINEAKHQAVVHYGNLRSGQELAFNKSVIVIGDVKPGATVTSNGSIFVLGSLRGSAYAGAAGDEKAFILALDFDPLQVRIANAIAISPDSDEGPRLKLKGLIKPSTEKRTEVAYILDGHIVKDVYGSAFLRNNDII